MALKNLFRFGKKAAEEKEEAENIVEIGKEIGKDKSEEKESEKKAEVIETSPKPLKDRLATPKKGFFWETEGSTSWKNYR